MSGFLVTRTGFLTADVDRHGKGYPRTARELLGIARAFRSRPQLEISCGLSVLRCFRFQWNVRRMYIPARLLFRLPV